MSLIAILTDVLAAIEDHATDESYALPDLRVIRAGQPPWTCEELAVYIEQLQPHLGDVAQGGSESFAESPGLGLRAATVVISLVRCAAVPTVVNKQLVQPTVAEQLAVAELVMGDAELIDQAIITSDLPGCNSLVPLGWTVVGPQGKFIAGEWRYGIGTDSFGELAS